MYSEIVEVTPQMAEDWLNKKNKRNRKIRKGAVDRLAYDMITGQWNLTHQGLAFDVKGNLLDGQHRLKAVSIAGRPIKFFVTYDVPVESVITMDTQATRSIPDVANFQGLAVKVRDAQVARVMQNRGETAGLPFSRQDKLDFLIRHQENIEKACELLPMTSDKLRKSLVRAPVTAGIARALYSCDPAKLERFCTVLVSGVPKKESEEVIIKLRDAILKINGTGFKANAEIYFKTQNAIRMFCEGTSCNKLHPATNELFPLAEESGMYVNGSKKRRT